MADGSITRPWVRRRERGYVKHPRWKGARFLTADELDFWRRSLSGAFMPKGKVGIIVPNP